MLPLAFGLVAGWFLRSVVYYRQTERAKGAAVILTPFKPKYHGILCTLKRGGL
jgi:hypothetical protein